MSNWTLIYSSDANGNAVTGSVSALAAAVRSAADVKVLYNPSQGVWWSRYCSSATVRGTGSASTVAATHMEAADTQGGGEIEFAAPAAVEYHIYNSNGVRKLLKLNLQTHQVLANQTQRMPMRWYVKDYRVFPLFAIADLVNADFERNP